MITRFGLFSSHWSMWFSSIFFFFQAEDGIRDFHVTGVQTCALPIWSRWLRAWRNSLGTHTEIVSLDEVTLQVNCGLEDDEDISSFMNAGQPAPLTLEGVANTTPLVLNTPFYPLGREPRLFDAFYLGSKEAFSKANALVTLDFTMANEWATPAAGLTSAGGVQAILALDLGGALRIARIETVAGERSVTWPAPTQPLDAEGKAVELDPKAGIGIAVRGNVMHA